VKRLHEILRILCLSVLVSLTTGTHAQQSQDSLLLQMKDVEIGLLTCSPGTEIWSLYGHTAIHFNDKAHNQDIAINYGMFNFRKSFFVLRFVFGLTDYEMGIEPYPMFLVDYAAKGRSVVEQRLDLTPEEKLAIAQAIWVNYSPENRVYRYNYFYDNCTTRARDILASHINGQVVYGNVADEEATYRKMIHQWNENYRWARFGNDLLLGVKADGKTDLKEQQFLPDSLRKDFARAVIVAPDGKKRPLVDSTIEVLKANPANVQVQPSVWDSISPTTAMTALLVLVILLTIVEFIRGKHFWLLDTVLLTLDGLAGLVLLAMVFSQHPTVSVNFQIFLLNPLSLVFAYPTVNRQLKGGTHWYWWLLFACLILFVGLGFIQTYAEGMYILALTLLIRIGRNLWHIRKSQ
jgi:hypothetical protein